MSTRLVILGLLRERPLYGYELKQLIEQNMGDWTNIAFGSIYFALRKLSEQGFVEKVATEQEGNRPSRSVYRITPAGEEEFMLLLRNAWTDIERQYYTVDIAFAFMDALPKEEILGHLQQRIVNLEAMVERVESQREETLKREAVPTGTDAVFDHGILHYQAERIWTRDCLQQMQSEVESSDSET